MDVQRRLDLLHSSIDLEMNISNLYLLYSRLFEEDRNFWWQISIEEKNHAALLRSGEHYIDLGNFPDELLFQKHKIVQEYNRDIRRTLEQYEANAPTQEEAYRYALRLEGSAAELHFQKTMDKESDSRVIQIFQKLCGDDKDHLRRIQELVRNKKKNWADDMDQPA